MDCARHLEVTAKGQHLRETAFQFLDEICVLRLRSCFKLYKAEAYGFIDLAAFAGDMEVAITGIY